MIAKIIIGGALVLGATVGLATPANADVVFNQFSCTCGAPPHSPAHWPRIALTRVFMTP